MNWGFTGNRNSLKPRLPIPPCRSFSLSGGNMSVPQFMRKQWTAEEVFQLRKLARKNTPAQVIARKLGRSIDAVYVKASREGLSLRLVPEQELPVSQS